MPYEAEGLLGEAESVGAEFGRGWGFGEGPLARVTSSAEVKRSAFTLERTGRAARSPFESSSSPSSPTGAFHAWLYSNLLLSALATHYPPALTAAMEKRQLFPFLNEHSARRM